jgi:hypothetical protein
MLVYFFLSLAHFVGYIVEAYLVFLGTCLRVLG